MQVLAEIEPTHELVGGWQRQGHTVGLVPSMGALHAGHVSLITAARARCAKVAVSIFVNPIQFGPNEDYLKYPRPIDTDLDVCRQSGVDVVFNPTPATMYPTEAVVRVQTGRLGAGLCGPFRPGHFDGVATVVAKLFHMIPANFAFFGEKDYQQLVVIRRMVHDLNFATQIVGCPTVREPDGLAMSSRNAYLVDAERRQAAVLSRALFAAVQRVRTGERRVNELVAGVRAMIRDAGPSNIEYVEAVDAESLESLRIIDRPARICLAARIGPCRLIDNVPIAP